MKIREVLILSFDKDKKKEADKLARELNLRSKSWFYVTKGKRDDFDTWDIIIEGENLQRWVKNYITLSS